MRQRTPLQRLQVGRAVRGRSASAALDCFPHQSRGFSLFYELADLCNVKRLMIMER
jgi:hypothetical protein